MSGYSTVFNTVYDGTLFGKWPGAAVFTSVFLALMDKNGHVDYSLAALAGKTGWPIELLTQGIEQLMQPDPHSRTKGHDGRRLVLIEEGRQWGWRIVNAGVYREKARLMAKTERERESGANAQRMRDRSPPPTADDRRPPPTTAPDPLSDANTNTEADKKEEALRASSSRARERVEIGEAGHAREFGRIREIYPTFSGRQDWINAQQACRQRVEVDGVPWAALQAAAARYRKFCEGGGVSGPRYVLPPGKFFAAADKPWEQAWELPPPQSGAGSEPSRARAFPS